MYKYYDLSQNKIILCRRVIFDELEFPFSKLHTPNLKNYQFLDNELSPYIINHLITQPGPHPMTSTHITHQQSQTHDQSELDQTTSQLAQTWPSTFTPPNIPLPPICQPTLSFDNKPVTRSQHGIFKRNQKYINLHTEFTRSPLPRNLVLALKDLNWKMTMDDEYSALIQNKTWDLVPHPPDANVTRSMWIFKHKENFDGSFERHKA